MVTVNYGSFKDGTYEILKDLGNVVEIKTRWGVGIVLRRWTDIDN